MTAVVAYLVAVGLGLLWCWLTATPVRLRGQPELSAPQVALLRPRGRRAALAAAVTELYAAGLVTLERSGRLRRGDTPMPAGLPEVARAVYRTLVLPRSLRSVTVRAPVRAALRTATDQLARLGAVPTRARRRWSRLVLVAMVVVTLLGVTRAGALPPLLVLPALLLVVAALMAWFLPGRTIAGARLLRRLRAEQAERTGPEPVESPAQAALANALTGMVLPGLEPALRLGIRDRRVLGDATIDVSYGGGGLGG